MPMLAYNAKSLVSLTVIHTKAITPLERPHTAVDWIALVATINRCRTTATDDVQNTVGYGLTCIRVLISG
jgi:hypothetical protein